ncbi:MAG: GatB/YqeY domain-containing protein [Acidobacteriaceae bacterium]|nr:GatB/YqeY domain-containing protein [Acidobacteriaceae bacterium]
MADIGIKIDQDIITAMKAKEAEKLTTLRLVKSILKSKEIDKREPLTEAEEQAALTTMLKQRRESIEQFTKGGRPELAAKEQSEITLIEAYLPKEASAEDLLPKIHGAIKHLTEDNGGTPPTAREMGLVIKLAKQRLLADGIRADGKLLSDLVRQELEKL